MAKCRFPCFGNVANIVLAALSRGATVEIDGLGSFRKIGRRYRFQPLDMPRVFVAILKTLKKGRSAVLPGLGRLRRDVKDALRFTQALRRRPDGKV